MESEIKEKCLRLGVRYEEPLPIVSKASYINKRRRNLYRIRRAEQQQKSKQDKEVTPAITPPTATVETAAMQTDTSSSTTTPAMPVVTPVMASLGAIVHTDTTTVSPATSPVANHLTSADSPHGTQIAGLI